MNRDNLSVLGQYCVKVTSEELNNQTCTLTINSHETGIPTTLTNNASGNTGTTVNLSHNGNLFFTALLDKNINFNRNEASESKQLVLKTANQELLITFDENSDSALENFLALISNLVNSRKKVEYYPSGFPHFYSYTDDENTGYVVEYYDMIPRFSIKYQGYYRKGKYDGEGEFRSRCGKYVVRCKNLINNRFGAGVEIRQCGTDFAHIDNCNLKLDEINTNPDAFFINIARLAGWSITITPQLNLDDKITMIYEKIVELEKSLLELKQQKNQRNVGWLRWLWNYFM